MIRKTSIEVYHQIKEEGLLSKRRMEVFKAITECAPCTSAEAMATIITKSNVLSQSRARFTELRNMGVIKELGERKCKITGRKVIEWDVTGDLPVNSIKKIDKKPKYLKKTVDFIIKKMSAKGIIWVSPSELKELIE